MNNNTLHRLSALHKVVNGYCGRTFCSSKSSPPNNSDSVKDENKVSAKNLLDDAATFQDDTPSSPENVWSTSPYPKGTVGRSQGLKSFRPMINPEETSIILFPGQGTQYVGMAKDLSKFPTAVDLFKKASSILNYDLLKLCMQGPAEKLNKTEFAQPAILVCSLGALERLKEEKPTAIENCIATAGFSLGEIAALVLAEVMSFERGTTIPPYKYSEYFLLFHS